MQFLYIDQEKFPTAANSSLYTVQNNVTDSTMWFDTSVTDIGTTRKLALGEVWWDRTTGNAFRHVKAGAALTCGQFVTFDTPTVGTVTNAGSTTDTIITNIDTTTILSQVGNYLWTLDAVGTVSTNYYKQSLRLIKQQSSGGVIGGTGTNTSFIVSLKGSTLGNNQFDGDLLRAVPANGSAAVVIRPFQVLVATASLFPVGVALGTVVSGDYTVIQVAGLAMIQANNGGASTAVGVPGAMQASGIFTGSASASITTQGCSILPCYAQTSATTSLIPAYINFLGT